MKQQLEQIRLQALAALEAADSPAALEELRVKWLGKKGELTAVLKMMGKLSAEERPVMGQIANAVRAELEETLEARKAELSAAALEKQQKAGHTKILDAGNDFFRLVFSQCFYTSAFLL